ncbi:hypothetical protein [Mucilaginibacter boryungensis]|uniref:Uncharacterized protein n=1 Tax=Mucilaginibacter boryungensis TaxID=768480 RepID=A0ABR9XGN5_9SPHI|nr:hypothetical protein [Mucilaginibacter boryungensis]MBE9666234.1 hypothetical protein [Mucilaginibacter boryungensis]
MKKVLLMLTAITMLFESCAVNKPITDDAAILNIHQQPYIVFGIGNWRPGYSILTLTDASHQYFTLKTVDNPSLKIGDVYQPQLISQSN